MIVEYDRNLDFEWGKKVLWFSIPGCPPCRIVENFMEELSEELNEINIVHVGAEKWEELVDRFEVLNVPTLVYLKDGKVLARQNLVRSKEEVLLKLEELRES